MIASFRHKGLDDLFRTGGTRRISAEHVGKCIRVLQMLEVAAAPQHLNVPGLRFHSLPGVPQRWAVRVSANYRITFGWAGESALDVDFEDYY